MTAHPPSPPSARIAAAIAVFIHGLLGLALLCGMLWLVPGYKRQFQREFREHEMALPHLTIVIMEISDWFAAYWYVVVLASLPLLALDGAIVFLCWSRKGTRILGVLWIILLIAVWLLFAVFAGFCLWLAYSKLLEGLSR
jgi:type II secretory pathway component PulF